MSYFWKTTVVVLCLSAATATQLPAQPQPTERTQVAQTTARRVATTKPSSKTTVAKTKKDRPGSRFWARIMRNFREVHSAEKKIK